MGQVSKSSVTIGFLATQHNDGTQAIPIVQQSYMTSDNCAEVLEQFPGPQQAQATETGWVLEDDKAEKIYVVKRNVRFGINLLAQEMKREDAIDFLRKLNKEIAEVIRTGQPISEEGTSAHQLLTQV